MAASAWKIRGGVLSLDKTLLMGIVNVTPDSFSDGGKYFDPRLALAHANRLIVDGADILDLGGESTRPGAQEVSEEDELKRILPVLESLVKQTDVAISIDTTKPKVARECLRLGAHIINNVSGFCSGEMAEIIAKTGAGIVLMHSRGNSKTMQSMARYEDVVFDVMTELRQSINECLRLGVQAAQIVADPGIGFAKTAEHNFQLLRNLEKFHELNYPILLGASEKSFLGAATGKPAGERGYATAAVTALGVAKKIQIMRVHDVKATRDVVRVAEKMSREIKGE